MAPRLKGQSVREANLTTDRAWRCPLTPHGGPVAVQDRRHVLQATRCSRIEGSTRYRASPPTPSVSG